jgi:hypothetical protein
MAMPPAWTSSPKGGNSCQSTKGIGRYGILKILKEEEQNDAVATVLV